MGEFEETYNDTLRSMELTLVRQYRQLAQLTDWEVKTAVNNLIRLYSHETHRRQPPQLRQDPATQLVYGRLRQTCEGWLGRAPLVDEVGNVTTLTQNALSVDEVIACLKRIRRSIEQWQKEGGRRGYFEFINEFFP